MIHIRFPQIGNHLNIKQNTPSINCHKSLLNACNNWLRIWMLSDAHQDLVHKLLPSFSSCIWSLNPAQHLSNSLHQETPQSWRHRSDKVWWRHSKLMLYKEFSVSGLLWQPHDRMDQSRTRLLDLAECWELESKNDILYLSRLHF